MKEKQKEKEKERSGKEMKRVKRKGNRAMKEKEK